MCIYPACYIYNLLFAHTPHREPIIPAAVAQAPGPGIEAQAPSVGGRAPRSRPAVAVRAYEAHGRTAAVTSGGEEHRVPVNLRCENITTNPCSIVVLRPHRITVITQLLPLIFRRHPPIATEVNVCCILCKRKVRGNRSCFITCLVKLSYPRFYLISGISSGLSPSKV